MTLKIQTRLMSCALAALTTLSVAPTALADEGMWLFSNFPVQKVQQRYGFQLTPQFLDHLRLSAVRFNNGGTGSFVSPNGLLFTNHHVGADCISKLSTAKVDHMKEGFYAPTQADEKACPDLEVNVLLKIEDVTAKVTAGITPQTPAAEANKMKKAAMSKIEKECNGSTGNRCDIVTLYSGGQYHLYQYKKYTDIRLVLAPEFGVAFFGGDPENFTYPRQNLDITFFRAYENGQPAKPEHYFKWAKQGVKEGDLTFVPGNPGSTGRLATMAELEFSRDTAYRVSLDRLATAIAALEEFGKKGPEQKRQAGETLFGLQNSFKAYSGFMRGLKDPELMSQKRAEERKLRDAIAKDPAQAEKFAKFWDELATTYKNYESFYTPFTLLERAAGRGSELFVIARDVLRYSEETKKPNADRLREFSETALPSLEQAMYSTAPIYPDLEKVMLTNYFEALVKYIGANDETVKAVLGGRTPAAAAAYYVDGCKLGAVELRKALAKDPAAVAASSDPMLVLAKAIDPKARQLRKRYEDQVESVISRAASQIAQARFALFGGNEYPDATFTMRLAYGDVRGYKNDKGEAVPYATDFASFYVKGKSEEPYIIPERWLKAKSALNLKTHFNFVTTADTHGGNSGSATLNTKGEVVGILFDGNIEGLPNRFVFTDRQARSVHVSSEGILEALKVVYKADRLLGELTAK